MARRDLTQGGIVRGIVAFALPLLGASVVQQLYSTVDMLFVGNVVGTQAVAALGVGSLLITLMVGLFSGMSVAANVRVANFAGVGDAAELRAAIRASMRIGIMGGLALAALGEALADPFIAAMEIPKESAADALGYLRFAVAATLPIAIFNMCSGALRGLGDSSTPFVAQAAGGVANVGANWFLLCVFGLGIEGCALATLASNGLAASIAVCVLVRRARECGVSGGGAGQRGVSSGGALRWMLGFGAPIAVQTVAITLSNVVVQHQVDILGVVSVAAFAVYLKVELPIYYTILAIGQATTTFVAQNYGARLHERCAKGSHACQALCLALALATSGLMLAILPYAFGIFDRSDDVISVGVAFARTTFPFYAAYAVLEVQADAMRGFGHSLAPALVVLLNTCVVRVAIVYASVGCGMGMQGIAASYPLTWTSSAVMLVVVRMILKRGRERRSRLGGSGSRGQSL